MPLVFDSVHDSVHDPEGQSCTELCTESNTRSLLHVCVKLHLATRQKFYRNVSLCGICECALLSDFSHAVPQI